MIIMICRNKVADYTKWRKVFDAHKDNHIRAGLHLQNVWQELDDPDNVFFTFEVEDREKALAYINDPVSAKAGEESGVIEGEFHFVKSI